MLFYPLYIDPGSGSILLQAIFAGAAGAVWRLVHLFRRRKSTHAGEKPCRNSGSRSGAGPPAGR